ncbi:MAG: PKD domain-containing protein [Aquificales bacterium]|nr:PKD domain-containing protein [Aquificales bacterium]
MAATANQTAVYSGVLHIEGPVQLDVIIDPPIGEPGDSLNLQVSARNQDIATHIPLITIQLPSQLNWPSHTLPAGATRNFQTNELTWRPVLAANGGSQQFILPLRVETIDITNPEQGITAVIDINGTDRQASTSIWLGLPPQIDNITVPSQISVGLPVQLRADTSGPGPIFQSWLLGDGRRVNVNNPVVVYPAVGVYDLGLEAKNAVGSTVSSRQITVMPHPTGQFNIDDPTPGLGQIVTFINESGGQQPLAYSWDFGDGTTANDLNPTHQYQTPGTFMVSLIVENEYGRSEAVWPVSVGQLPVADMQIGDFVAAGQPLFGQAFGDETVNQFVWDMGDGRSETGEQIAHAYMAQGDYYVNLAAIIDLRNLLADG